MEFLDNQEKGGGSKKMAVAGLFNMMSIMRCINKKSVDGYVKASAMKINPVFHELFDCLREWGVKVYVISNGYMECISPLLQGLGVKEGNIAANQFVWWRDRVICVSPSVLHGVMGKVEIVRRWRAAGLLQGRVIMVGDGPADRKVYQSGLVHGFIQADYYRAGPQTSLPGNVRVATAPEQLKAHLDAMLLL